ncbi:MAG TPA: DUF6069 family protein [Anaerolineae bacterium]
MIELQNITKLYHMGDETVHALQDVSLKIEDGEYVAIIGPSGSGKSTLMNILGCLDIPTSGTYNLNGTMVSRMRESQLATVRNKNIGLIFQNFNLLGKATAIRNVELPARYGGIGPAERHKRAMAAMTSVGLAHRTHHKPTELSGGQQQRVAIARALVNSPSILLADEPTGALDSKTGKEILDLFEQLQRENGITVIVVTHDPNVARRAHRVITIRDGRIESDIARQQGKDGVESVVVHQESVTPHTEGVEEAPVMAYQDVIAEEMAADQAKKKKVAFEGPIPFKRLALLGAVGIALAIVVNIVLSQIAYSVLNLRAPMLQLQQVALFTLVGTVLAVLVFAAVNRFAKRPIWLFRIIAVAALILSFVPDIGLATGLFNPFAFLGGGQRNGAATGTNTQNTGTGQQTTGGGVPGGALRLGGGGGGIGAGLAFGARSTGNGTGGNNTRISSPLVLPGTLVLLHIVAYGIVVGMLTRRPRKRKEKISGRAVGIAK